VSALLSAQWLAELEALRKRLRFDIRSRGGGNHLSKRKGASAEFLEHRAYAEGDDLRRLDWAVFARTGEPSIKLFRAEEDTCMRIFLDTSASLQFGTPPKFEVGRRIAAGIGYIALASSERAQVLSGADALAPMTSAARGRGGIARFMRELEGLSLKGRGDLSRCLQSARKAAHEKSVFVVLSDFFDAGPVLDALSALSGEGHTVVALQLLAHEEAHPTLHGDYTLVDSESGDELALTIDDESIDDYRRRLAALFANLQNVVRRTRGVALQVVGDASPPEVALRVLSTERHAVTARAPEHERVR
jgi:uncharacterized protein (DUF58 family)